MTIESASFPHDLSEWDGKNGALYYFEVFGETAPLLDTTYAEVISRRRNSRRCSANR